MRKLHPKDFASVPPGALSHSELSHSSLSYGPRRRPRRMPAAAATILAEVCLACGCLLVTAAGVGVPLTAAEPSPPHGYHPTLGHDPPVPPPPASAVSDFETFLQRLAEASERNVEALILEGDALDHAEQVLLDSAGVPEEIELARHTPFVAVNPEAIFALYADLPTLEKGFALYQQNCAQCHGVYGRGNGPATFQWYTGNYPRSFIYGKYKSRSTDYGTSPTDRDLFRTLTRGLYGSSMPSFRHLSEADRWALVQFLKTLANIFDDYDEVVLNRFDPEGDHAPIPLDMSDAVPATAESVHQGRALFVKHGCVTCHQGDQPEPRGLARSAGTFSNWADEMNRPIQSSRDLTTPVFLAGSSSEDLYRIIAGGPNIGPMPNYQTLPRAELWALVRYMESLFKPDYPQTDSTPVKHPNAE